MANFKREPKMKTTEPSDDEVGGGMKRGGRTHKAIGGGLPAGRITGALPPGLAEAMSAVRPRGAALLSAQVPRRPNPGIPVAKKGGKMHKAEGGAAEERREEKEIHSLKTELKSHEGKRAGAAHHGLKRGGKATPGGLLGGVVDREEHEKPVTRGVEGPGYKRGGKMHKAAGGHVDTTKVVGAKQVKTLHSNTGGVEEKFACGGKMKKFASGGVVQTTKVVNDEHPRDISGRTGTIKQGPAGYKRGGHVEAVKGHDACGHTAMKRGGSW